MYPSQNNLEQRKRKNKDYNKNASENKNCLSKAKNASDQMERLRPSQAFRFFWPFCFARYPLVKTPVTLDSRLHPPQKTGSPFWQVKMEGSVSVMFQPREQCATQASLFASDSRSWWQQPTETYSQIVFLCIFIYIMYIYIIYIHSCIPIDHEIKWTHIDLQTHTHTKKKTHINNMHAQNALSISLYPLKWINCFDPRCGIFQCPSRWPFVFYWI